MKTFDADSMYEPFSVTLGGQTFEVTSVSQTAMEKLINLGKAPESERGLSAIVAFLAIVFGVEVEALADVDARGMLKAFTYVNEQINGKGGDGEEKNVASVEGQPTD